MDLNCLAGCSRVSIVMTIESAPNESVRLLPSFETDESPLDIIVDLMVSVARVCIKPPTPHTYMHVYSAHLLIKLTKKWDNLYHSMKDSRHN